MPNPNAEYANPRFQTSEDTEEGAGLPKRWLDALELDSQPGGAGSSVLFDLMTAHESSTMDLVREYAREKFHAVSTVVANQATPDQASLKRMYFWSNVEDLFLLVAKDMASRYEETGI